MNIALHHHKEGWYLCDREEAKIKRSERKATLPKVLSYGSVTVTIDPIFVIFIYFLDPLEHKLRVHFVFKHGKKRVQLRFLLARRGGKPSRKFRIMTPELWIICPEISRIKASLSTILPLVTPYHSAEDEHVRPLPARHLWVKSMFFMLRSHMDHM